ncbi:LysR family transcriptional regulator [Prescottella equi]|nr:LysR family transcriptional regulator [Prescottella equi]QDP08266.1 LysR family transcriptional regulator [Prescottella equi]
MNVDELRWFVALAESGHMRDAADDLHISQPTLSRALARIERQVGVPLFDRVNHRLQLNDYGRIMLEHTRRSLTELHSASERIAALRNPESGTVRLGFLHSLASWFVPEIIRVFRESAPQVNFALDQAPSGDIEAMLARGEIDVAVIGPRPAADEFDWYELYVERLCLAVPESHPLAGHATIRVADALDDAFVMLRKPFGLRRLTDELFAAAGVVPRIVFETIEIPTIEGLVAAGFGVAVVPSPRPTKETEGVRYVPLDDVGAFRPIGLAWPVGREPSPVVARFIAFLVSRGQGGN